MEYIENCPPCLNKEPLQSYTSYEWYSIMVLWRHNKNLKKIDIYI